MKYFFIAILALLAFGASAEEVVPPAFTNCEGGKQLLECLHAITDTAYEVALNYQKQHERLCDAPPSDNDLKNYLIHRAEAVFLLAAYASSSADRRIFPEAKDYFKGEAKWKIEALQGAVLCNSTSRGYTVLTGKTKREMDVKAKMLEQFGWHAASKPDYVFGQKLLRQVMLYGHDD
jgi:hypothetical protein